MNDEKPLVDTISLACFPFPEAAAATFLFLPPRVLSIGGEMLRSVNADEEDGQP